MSSDTPLRVAAIGVGHLGRHHARILSTLPGATLVGVVDVKPDRAAEIAAAHGSRPFTDYRDLLGQVDAVSIAVPTEAHLEVASAFLDRGIPVLVEKPLARSVEDADRMIALAASRGVDARRRSHRAVQPGGRRRGPAAPGPALHRGAPARHVPGALLDIDVVFDLMIHDLDVVLSIVRSPVASVEAVGVPVLTGRVDIANARLRFENGCIANITASRISRDRVRKIRFFQPDAYLSIDYAAQEVEVYRLVRGAGVRPGIEGGKLEVPREEPLVRELADFLGAVREGRPPLVTGHDGRRALELAERITERMAAGA